MLRHLASVGEIVDDVEAAVRFYRDVLGLSLDYEEGAEYVQVEMPGVLHYAIWSRRAAAEACFGDPNAVNRVPLGFTVGFEVEGVSDSVAEVEKRGWPLLHGPKEEPWGQETSRFLSPGGSLCEIARTPWARQVTQDVQAQEG